ncbi:ribonuclease H-like domain-containing protein [Tanacetum coccineum]
MWLFRHKYLAYDTLTRYKARLVANDSTQLEGIEVDESFCPVVKPGTILIVLSLATFWHWPVHQLDVKNAFLHDDLFESVYMHQPPGFRDSAHHDYVCLLQRSLYGLKQAPRAWFQRFAAYITRVEFHHSRCDTSLFIYRQGNLGPLNYFLAISVTRDSFGMFLSQRKYDVEIFERAHMINCNPSRTPVDTKSKLEDDSELISDPTLYRSLADLEIGLVALLLDDRLPVIVSFLVTTYSLGPLSVNRSFLVQVLKQSIVVLPMLLLRLHQRTKHIEIDIHFVRDLVAAGQVRVLHVPSRYQYVDIFTKDLPFALFEEFRTSLSVRCPLAQTAKEC